MATVKPVAIVSPMKKTKKTIKKSNKICPDSMDIVKTGSAFKKYDNKVNYDVFNKRPSFVNDEESCGSTMSEEKSTEDQMFMDKKSNRLCSMFENLNLQPEEGFDCSFHDNIASPSRIPEHDRKILERMAFKMRRDISNVEMAHKAHILWQSERETREKLLKEEEEEYNKYIQTKRQAEKEIMEQKFQELKEIYDWEKKHLKRRLVSKDRLTAKRIQELEQRKNRDIQWRHKVAEEKSRNALEVLREHKLAEVLWRKQLAHNLDQRLLHAVNNKEILLKYCRQRAIIDNRIHQELQRQNWRDQKELETERWQMLKRKVESKKRKINRIQQEKDKIVVASRRLADSTARMRENLKRSLSPDTFMRAAVQSQHQHYRSTPQMCLTPNNFESHIRLG